MARDKTGGKMGDKSRGKSKGKTSDKSRGKSKGKTGGKSKGKTSDKPRGKTSDKSRGKTSDKSRGKTSDKPRGKTSDKPRGKTSDKSRGKTSDKPRGKTSDRTREKTSDRTREKTSDMAREKTIDYPRIKTRGKGRGNAKGKSGLNVIYEDNHLIVINKDARVLVHGDASGDTPLTDYVKSYIKRKYKKEGDVFLGVTHRLDRPVSGAIIFARTTKALTRMQKLFADRKIQKTYWAISKKRPDPLQGHIKNYLYKDTEKNASKALDKPSRRHPDAKLSEMDYALIGEVSGNHLIEAKPLTGRSHQIRVQLAGIGCTIVGDVKYGFPHRQWKGNINLHSRSMTFEHPVKKKMMTVTADPPKDDQIWRMFNQGGFW